ncbi:hypothetical protein [Paenibacillus sp. L3-i20]|uniref:hypothetical protein n=1 Tax=Paenibacillus sp. L3-i20 TaxID=2905833 RepID=UPI001EE0F661|nr:hypothetical protein [Paenibacillus sp. L3-i20]GKU76617.1 hypothetical protein L3i20_v210140 [Paenibacillus sp. L3-i20]
MSLLFNITSFEGSLHFLKDYLEIDPKSVIEYVKSDDNDVDIDDFIDKFKISLDKLEHENIEAVALHVTSNDDDCKSIKSTGLLNLQQALTMNTPIKKYLREFQIEFDVSNKILWVKGNQLDITYNSSWSNDKDERLDSVARKVYFDHQINGFFSIQDAKDYDGRVHERPEILHNLKELFKAGVLEDRWKQTCKPYVIKYKAPLDYFTYYSFYSEKYEYEEDYEEKRALKVWLINNALYVVWNMVHKRMMPEIFAYMKPEVSIIPEKILEIIPLDVCI